MTKTIFCLGFILLLHFFPAPAAEACTSFAAYGDGPLYAMNFDYPADSKLRFVIEEHGDLKLFQLMFSRRNRFEPTAGLNSAGLFIAIQTLEGERILAEDFKGPTIFPGQFYQRALRDCRSVAAARDILAGHRLLRSPYLGLHLLVADASGDAMVVEVGRQENQILDIEASFTVMTNFSHTKNLGCGYDDLQGVGVDRYRIVHEGLTRSEGRLDVDRAFHLLAKALNRSDDYPTRCSMVFDPVGDQIFLTLEGDFMRIWRISLEDGIIETQAGFEVQRQWELNGAGLMATDLE